ncbi:3-oxoacyl-ACP synthase [Caldifermentibacillus hisashii]|jgi:3-oxoacyl-[acyl-carrier-protein] synthase-3|uniref:3-oxoacyl-ACP synthase n=1 Tax=Caldifermentibacillus hisashii TaxID=996558 RepID=UPI001FD3DA51|nr:3-oxoacyl-ACP synthase [Caldifermentibacillus hisashii]MEC5272434.1 3-oxoacyl-ACP synthase [Caldifermentibacillus hisashii]
MNNRIGIEETGVFFPNHVETAGTLAEKSGIPEQILKEKFGILSKHVADSSLQASDLAIEAGKQVLQKVDPLSIDVVIYFGSPHKDYYVWSSAPKISYELGTKNAYAFEIMNVSSCFPIALKVAKDMLKSDQTINNILLVGGCKESQILDYQNKRARFMFNFADGGAAALVKRGTRKSEILESAIITDGSFHDDVRVPAGGSVSFASYETVENRLHYIDVTDPLSMKERLDSVSIPNFHKVIRKSLENSGLTEKDIDLLLPLHTKRSMFNQLLKGLHVDEENAIYLEQHGHMSALDPCVGLHFAQERGKLREGDIAVVVSAGTGYTWASTVIRWLGG